MIEVDDLFLVFLLCFFSTGHFGNVFDTSTLRIQAVVFMQLGIKAVHHQIQWILVSKKLILYSNVKL